MKDKDTLLREYNERLANAEKIYSEGITQAKLKFESTTSFFERQKANMEQSAKRDYEASIANLDSREEKKQSKTKKDKDPEAFLKKIKQKDRHSILQSAGRGYGRDTVLKDFTDEQVEILKQIYIKETKETLGEIKQAEDVIEQKKEKEEVELHSTIGSIFFTGEPESQEPQEEQEEQAEITTSDEEYENSEEHKEYQREYQERMRKAREKLAEKQKAKELKEKDKQNDLSAKASSSDSFHSSELVPEQPKEEPKEEPNIDQDALALMKDDNHFAELRRKAQQEDLEKVKEVQKKPNLINANLISKLNQTQLQPILEPEAEQEHPKLISNTKIKKPVKQIIRNLNRN